MKTVAILQSNYIPWKGYFDLISKVDEFVFLDDVQYTNRDWRNRNKIKTHQGVQWLSIPCGTNRDKLICEVSLGDHSWQKMHWQRIEQAYSKAPYFTEFADRISHLYLDRNWDSLSELNQTFIKYLSKEILDLKTVFCDSRQFPSNKHKQDRILDILLRTKADRYISGPAAKDYLRADFLEPHGIELEWMTYGPYPEYDQLYPPFEHGVSIVDLLVHTWPNARAYIHAV